MAQRRFQWDADEQAFCATVPSLSGCVTFGKTRGKAIERAQEAIVGYIESLELCESTKAEDWL